METIKDKPDFLKVPELSYSYGDVKEIPNSLFKEIYDAMFYSSKHLHPNQKYRDHDGRDHYEQVKRATEQALKQILPRDERIKELEQIIINNDGNYRERLESLQKENSLLKARLVEDEKLRGKYGEIYLQTLSRLEEAERLLKRVMVPLAGRLYFDEIKSFLQSSPLKEKQE